jgi:hypothetical protein
VATNDCTLGSPEAIVIDGANGVTQAPRQHFPHANREFAIALGALLVALALRKYAMRWVPLVLVAAAIPGFLHVFVWRGDAPGKRSELSREVNETMVEFSRVAPWPSARVNVVYEEDDVLFPLLRYARPTREKFDGGIPLEVIGTNLQMTCTEKPDRIVCGDTK